MTPQEVLERCLQEATADLEPGSKEDMLLHSLLLRFNVAMERMSPRRAAPSAEGVALPKQSIGDDPKFQELLDKFSEEDCHYFVWSEGFDDLNNARSALITYIDARTARNEWIKVADRLPTEGVHVLTVGAKSTGPAVMVYTKHDDWQIETASEWHSSYAPTHWMPLPAAPQMDKGREEGK